MVGDNPGVKSLAWHSVVALLGTAPPTKCLDHKYINTELPQLPERFTRCSVHSPQRVAIKNKSGKTNSTPEPFERGPALQYIPMLQKYPMVHSYEKIAVSSFNIFDIQLDVRLCKECDNIY